ncbi:hypothetical protein HPP92_019911 [Vanilla planifolia]|uniref:Uncharacterized protein n=1 Tax=Vanilla planifolia TaxID=51239 RepID=A0A835Q9Q0_VANPL|nr:hypothetical protein HPP92_019911 [Vanilla planifolia]
MAARKLAMDVIGHCSGKLKSSIRHFLVSSISGDDNLDIRQKAVQLLGDLFALLGVSISESFQPLFSEFVKRLTDRVVNVRISVVQYLKNCLVSNTTRPEAPLIITETARLVADRLRDKSLSVKRYTMERLADLYRSYCLNCTDNSITNDGFEWIPGRILRCLYDKDFRSETIEYVLCGSLLPFDLSIRNRVKHWIKAFSTFDKVETKALEQILMQKQRLQQEFQKYLTLRQTHQDNVSELQKRLSASIRIMSRLFHDATKAEEVKCSYLLFNKAHVKEMIVEASEQKSFGCDGQYISSCMDLLTVIASFSSQLFVGCQDDLVILLKEDNEIIKEGVARVLSKAGGNIREQLAMTSSSIDLLLERLCLEGTRKQAKYSVHALAAITKDDGLKSLSVLYKRLVDMLEEKRHLPSVLQSLGCIAQIAMPVLRLEDEIVEFIVKKVLEHSNETASSHSIYWDERSELCSLKMLGIKTLVKSYLHINDASSRTGIDRILGMLRNILTYGDISNDIHSSAVDKAHMKLTAAKSVLRLSRQWDDKIPLDIFYMTLRITEGAFPQFRKLFISKLHQYIKDRLLDAKYACAFLLNINQYQSPEYKEVKQYLLEVVQICHQLKLRQISMQNDVSSSVMYPESILVYLVHALAHHPSSPNVDECKDLTSFEPIYWRLHLFLSVLLLGDDGWQSGGCLDRRKDSYASVVSIFHTIKCSEDAADITKSRTSHGISDLGLAIAKKLLPDQADNSDVANKVSLPSMLYKSFEKEKKALLITLDLITPNDDNGEHSWLSSESALAHFEALMFEDKEQIVSDANKDSIILDKNDGDDNEVPLGKMMKLLKSHASKKKKMKTQTSNLEMKNMDEDVDVLGMWIWTRRKWVKSSGNSVKNAKSEESPVCQRFYEGIVHSYVPETGKHNILYDDGDVEIPMRQLFSTHLQRSPVVTEKSSKSNSQLNNKPIKRSIGPHVEGKHVSGKISQRFKKISEKDSISNMDDERDLEESNGDPHYESDNVNSDENAEGNAAERTEELEEMDISSPKSKEYSDNEPLRLWRQRAGKAG